MGKHVLIVEDQVELREVICLFLKQVFDVVTYEAENGEQALAILESNPQVDLMITDLNMPQLNGIELTRKVRSIERLQTLPILMLTAESDEYRAIADEVGVTEFFNKPMQPETLLPAVEKYLNA